MWLSTIALLFASSTPNRQSSPLAGPPISPLIVQQNKVLVRYMYDGGVLAHARLFLLEPEKANVATGSELLRSLADDGVDFTSFYASVYESDVSGGGWLPLHRNELLIDDKLDILEEHEIELPIPEAPGVSSGNSEDQSASTRRRIDVKLFRRPAEGMPDRTNASMMTIAAAQTTGKLPKSLGYFGIGVMGAKTQSNVGTVWRSAYQMGASFLFTIGQRYRSQATDTVNAPTRIPLFELDDWTAFAKFAPRGCQWVAVEMGGTPLEEFDHPTDAVYILGSEDQGVPNSIVRACHHVISLDSVNYASYNVAVAGSLVMYDRMIKMKAIRKAEEGNIGK